MTRFSTAMKDIGPNVADHLDRTLGIQGDQSIWSYDKNRFWILKYDNKPQHRACSYITAGLGKLLLKQESGDKIRQELMLTVWDGFAALQPEEKLAALSSDYLRRRVPIPNHQIISWTGNLFDGLEFSALYCTGADHMPRAFRVIDSAPDLVFVRLIPVYPEEEAYYRKYGWSKFNDLIGVQQPDFFDLRRPRLNLVSI